MINKNGYRIFDLHGDLFSHFTRAQMKGESNVFEKYHLSNFRKGCVEFAVFNVWIDDESVSSKQRLLEILSYSTKEVIQSKDFLYQVKSNSDINNFKTNKINYLIGLEGIDYLDRAYEIYALYQYGVRLISLTWNHNNAFATSCKSTVDNGLTTEGRKAVEIMNELGIVIDISHLSDESSYEILNISKDPVIASHSNVRSLCDNARNLSDDLIIAIAKTNGVIGVNAYPAFIADNNEQATLYKLVEHIKYIKNLVGVQHIAFGFDFMYYLSDDALDSFIEGSVYLEEFRNQSDIQKLVVLLEKEGFTRNEIESMSYSNALRVFKTVLK